MTGVANVCADDPTKDPHIRGDPYKTLFVSRLSYDVKETDLEREFGRFGPIERVCICAGHKIGYGWLTRFRFVSSGTRRLKSPEVMHSLYMRGTRT